MLAGERNPGGTLLIDLDLSFGQVSSHLNLEPKQTLVELARDDAALREPELFRTYMVPHPSGIQVLAAPLAPGFASLIDAARVELVLERALEAFDIVIVDAGTTFDDRMLAISSRSDTVIVPVLPEIPALNAVHLLMDQLTETGALGATTVFVLNNAFSRDLLKRSDIENALGAPISADLPVRLDRLPQGGERGQPGGPQRAEVDGRQRPAQPRQHRPRAGRRAHGGDRRQGPGHREARQGAPRPVRPPPLAPGSLG